MPLKPYLSIVIPAYNEADRIVGTLESLQRFANAQAYSVEVIVVNDGSTDATSYVVESFMDEMPYLRLVHNPGNKGKGYAVRNGMLKARGDYRLFMDADNSVTISHVGPFLDAAQKGSEVVIGSIRLPNATVKEGSGSHRRVLGKMAKYMIKQVVNPGVYDTQRGFKLFSREAAEKLFTLQTIDRFSFDVELLVLARRLDFTITELPVRWANPAGSKVTLFSYPKSLWELLVIKKNLLFGAYNLQG